MDYSVERAIGQLANHRDQKALRKLLRALGHGLSTRATAGAGLVIKAGASALAKTGATAYHAIVDGRMVTIAAATDMPALTGLDLASGEFNVACFFIDVDSTVSVAFGTKGTSRAAVKFPPFPEKKALVGYLIITHNATFTGGTTALDTATTEYVSPTGPIDPTVLLDR